MATLNLFIRKSELKNTSKFAARAHRGDIGVTRGIETPSGLFGSITWAVTVASNRYNKVKSNAYVNGMQYNRFELIKFVNSMEKPYIIASPKDLLDWNIATNNRANACMLTQTKKMIWAVDYSKATNHLTLMPVR